MAVPPIHGRWNELMLQKVYHGKKIGANTCRNQQNIRGTAHIGEKDEQSEKNISERMDFLKKVW